MNVAFQWSKISRSKYSEAGTGPCERGCFIRRRFRFCAQINFLYCFWLCIAFLRKWPKILKSFSYNKLHRSKIKSHFTSFTLFPALCVGCMWRELQNLIGLSCTVLIVIGLDCKTVGFFLKISKEIGKVWLKSLARAQSRSLFSASFQTFCLTARAYLIEYAKIRTVLQSMIGP